MIAVLVMLTASASCDPAGIDAPYRAMEEGFRNRDPAMVASAYSPTSVLGGVDRPEVHGAEEMTQVFAYVAPEDGRTLAIDFKIVHRDRADDLVADVGLYRIRVEGREPSYGQFTTVTVCGADGVWHFIADLMTRAGEPEWRSAECVPGAPCAD